MFESLLNPEALASYFAFAAIVLIPFYIILKRAGLQPLWSAVIFVPYTGLLIVMGVLAFKRWPVEPPKVKKERTRRG